MFFDPETLLMPCMNVFGQITKEHKDCKALAPYLQVPAVLLTQYNNNQNIWQDVSYIISIFLNY